MGPGNDWLPAALGDLFPSTSIASGALDLLPLPSLVLASDASALAVNREWTRLSGVPAEASRGEGWLGALESLDRGPLRRLLVGAAAAGEPGSGDYRLTGLGGDQWCRWWWQPGAPGQLVVCVANLDEPVPRGSVPLPRVASSRLRLVPRGEFVNLTSEPMTPAGPVGPALNGLAVSAAPLAPAAPPAPPAPAEPAAVALDVAADLVNRLFRIGLRLASAASLANGPARTRLEEAIDELDAIINDIRTAAFTSRFGSGTAEDAE